MDKNYLTEKKKKKKSAVKAAWVLVILAIVFIVIIAKFAFSGSADEIVNGMPSSDDVYAVAKSFVRPTLKSAESDFSDSEYQFGKKEDSVFVIKSYVKTKDNGGEEQKMNFEVTLKYKGGEKQDQKNWELINLNED